MKYINGFFYNNKTTGMERFATEITKELDSICKKNEITIVLPPKTTSKFKFKNINTLTLLKTPYLQLKNIKLNILLLFTRRICVNYLNHIPFFGKNIVFLHDIYYKIFPEDCDSQKDIKARQRALREYKKITKKAKMICTVSEYSKQQIISHYHVNPDKISVIYNSSEYMKKIISDTTIFNKYPQLIDKSFYFTLGSLAKRKNLKWILEHAKLFPKEQFVISGSSIQKLIPKELEELMKCQNIILAGYLSDEQVKAMMEHCKAFIFPSYFEGFGIPPLEALYCGCPIIIANSSCLPEIYEDCAHYIDPTDANINLDELLKEKVANPEKLFQKYSARNQAEKLYYLIQNI